MIKEADDMATKSILKNIKVDKNLGKSLASALEQSQAVKSQKNNYSQPVNRVEKSNIKKFLGIDKNDR